LLREPDEVENALARENGDEDKVIVFEERSAIIEHCDAAPRVWADAFATLHPDRPPPYVTPGEWGIFVDDCERFIDRWAVDASSLGWTPNNLFGWDPCRPFPLIAIHIGLGWHIKGGIVVKVAENDAIILQPSGREVSFEKRC
jgi:hypothetical protein